MSRPTFCSLVASSRSFGELVAPAFVAVTVLAGQFTPAFGQGTPSANRESVAIEPYTGPPVFLPEAPPPPPPKRVESRVVKENFPGTETPQFERGVVRFSDDSFVSDGPHKEYYSSGQLYVDGEYNLGKATGEWTYYHPNGEVAKKVTYSEGRPDGEVRLFNDAGALTAVRVYDSGKRAGTWETYSDDGSQKLIEQSYVDGLVDGVVRAWYSNGQLRQESTFKAGKRDGVATEWSTAGVKRAEISFKDGQRDGKSTLWQRDGRVVEQTYEAGRLVKRSDQ